MEVMQLFGMQPDEDMQGFVGRTKALVVLMAAVMQVQYRFYFDVLYC